MRGLRQLQYPYGCHWSDEFQKSAHTFRKVTLSEFCGHYLPSKHFFDPVNTALAIKQIVKAI